MLSINYKLLEVKRANARQQNNNKTVIDVFLLEVKRANTQQNSNFRLIRKLHFSPFSLFFTVELKQGHFRLLVVLITI